MDFCAENASPSSTAVHGDHYDTENLVEEGTSVAYLEPARISKETETGEIGREDITVCYQSDMFLELDYEAQL